MEIPEVTNGDIEEVSRLFGYTYDEERQLILQHRETVDVRACPGSGKTSLLVAKLAIVASKWRSKHRGMCIVSHTNVAHREIQKRFALKPGLHALDAYPHFLGTLQSFIDTFLGIPATVEYFGLRPVAVDNDTFAAVALHRFQEGKYFKARSYYSRRQDGQSIVTTLQYTGASLALGSGEGGLPSPDSSTYKELTRLKDSLSKSGYFRFEDMTALGTWLVAKYPQLPQLLAQRFPVVFIDEMQDTVEDQGRPERVKRFETTAFRD